MGTPFLFAREKRRSTRVRLKVAIEAQSTSEPLACEGETVVVNFHGALLSTATVLRVNMQIEVHVLMTGRRASAKSCLRRSRDPAALWNCARSTEEHLGC